MNKVKIFRVIAVLLLSFGFASNSSAKSSSLRGAFYYIWYPQSWTDGGSRLQYNPMLGLYSSGDNEVIKNHIKAMEFADIDFGIISWWGTSKHPKTGQDVLTGPATNAHAVFRAGKELMKQEKKRKPLVKWAIYYEQELNGNPSVDTLKRDLQHIKDNFVNKYPGQYLKINGKPVIFVYDGGTSTGGGQEEYATRWSDATAGQWYTVLKVFSGFKNAKKQPSAWHQYGGSAFETVVSNPGTHYSTYISPGTKFCDPSRGGGRARDLNTWTNNVKSMNASPAKWHLIISFNEWCEGTAIEHASEWRSNFYGTYLDALHNNPLDN